jgi:transmembrane sensor
MTHTEEQIRTAVAQQAGEWFVANQTGELSHADRTAFVAWFKASPIHVEEYLGVALIASDLKVAAQDPPLQIEELVSQARADRTTAVVSLDLPASLTQGEVPRRGALRPWSLAAATGMFLGIGISAIWWLHDGALLGLPKTYQTVHGEQLVQRLPDGSGLYLDTDSAVTVRYSGQERRIDVDRGQALFEVVQDRDRGFRVVAGNTATIAIGTRFNVYRKLDSTTVTVAAGRVAVVAGPAPRHARQVDAGYQVHIDGEVMSAQPTAVDLDQTLGWVRQKIAFERRPLGEVAEEFNRYGRIPLEIDDAELRALPVSGVFNVHDTESFTRFLSRLDGVIVERTATRIRILRMKRAVQPITTTR